MKQKRIAIVQSNYLPWKGYFDLIGSVDEFLLFDDVQFTKRDWRNRNQIKTPQGVQWISLAVETKGKRFQRINEVRVSEPDWATQHLSVLHHNYAKAPHFEAGMKWLDPLLRKAGTLERLSEINHLLLTEICAFLGITTPLKFSSAIAVDANEKNDRLIQLCRAVGATDYLSGPAARGYLDESLFRAQGIEVHLMDYSGYREYPQLNPPFTHFVSIVDLILNTGDQARTYLKCAGAEQARLVG